jgi:hypothetical protein
MTLRFKHRTSVFYLCVAAGSLPGKVCAVRTAGYRKTYKKFTLFFPPATLTISNFAFCIYWFCMVLCVNRDYFQKQDDLCNGEVLFSLWYGLNS